MPATCLFNDDPVGTVSSAEILDRAEEVGIVEPFAEHVEEVPLPLVALEAPGRANREIADRCRAHSGVPALHHLEEVMPFRRFIVGPEPLEPDHVALGGNGLLLVLRREDHRAEITTQPIKRRAVFPGRVEQVAD
mgnify:CR=1 FL=1|tara:strand:+ start:4062 stop:4466 length:405 start_codon:yes stop_codon:yes gene_type:complete